MHKAYTTFSNGEYSRRTRKIDPLDYMGYETSSEERAAKKRRIEKEKERKDWGRALQKLENNLQKGKEMHARLVRLNDSSNTTAELKDHVEDLGDIIEQLVSSQAKLEALANMDGKGN